MRIEILAVAAKEIQQTRRDPRTLVVLVIAPILQMVLLGFAVEMDVRDVPTIVADADHSAESRAFTRGALASDVFLKVGQAGSVAEAAGAIEQGDAQVAIVLPQGFAAAVQAGRPAPVQLLVDGSDAQRAIVAQNAIAAYAMRGQKRPPVAILKGRPDPRVRILYNPLLDSQIYFVPGVAATLLLMVTLITTAMGLAREKEDGTLEQVLVTPLSPFALVLGKTLPYAIIGLFDLAVAIAVGAVLFGVPIRGPLPVLFLAGIFYLLTNLGLGLFLASIARTQQQAFMGAFFVMLPMVLMSGFMSPISNMPEWLQPLTLLDPVRHMVEVLRGVLLKAATFSDLASQIGILALMGISVFTASVLVLRRRLV